MSVGFGKMKDFVPCVRAAHSDQNTILSRKVGNNVPLTFTAIFSAHYYIYKPFVLGSIEAEMARSPYEDIFFV